MKKENLEYLEYRAQHVLYCLQMHLLMLYRKSSHIWIRSGIRCMMNLCYDVLPKEEGEEE